MDTFEQAALHLEEFLYARRPLKAKAREEARTRDTNLAMVLQKGEYQEFDGVVYVPKTREVYCSFYDHKRKSIVLVPAIDLLFQDRVVQHRVTTFKTTYYG